MRGNTKREQREVEEIGPGGPKTEVEGWRQAKRRGFEWQSGWGCSDIC
jgi:hypothetical protein